MNEQAQNFIKNLALLCEEWTIVYRSFLNQGLSTEEALMHTKAFMGVMIANIPQNNGGDNDGE